MDKRLTISIFAYKQAKQIKSQLDGIAAYDGDDIEVVISDDTTDDTIRDLVASYSDNRFRYVKNDIGSGADGNYLNAILSAETDYVWIFRSSDSVIPDRISSVINLIETNPDCTLYFPSSVSGKGFETRNYQDCRCNEVWHSGTLHPSGYIINKKYCDFNLYKRLIIKHFGDYKASNVAFSLLQADLGLKGETLFSEIAAWKYANTVARADQAVNAPGGKNPFGLEFEYKRYALMLDYASGITDDKKQRDFLNLVIHTYAKQILHVFGKRNSSEDFLRHYGCEKVEFNPYKERQKFKDETVSIMKNLGLNAKPYKKIVAREALIYGVIKPTIYRIRNKK